MDIQRASRDSANAALKIAREELDQMTLNAPLSGKPACRSTITRWSPPARTIVTLTRSDLMMVFSIPENLFSAFDIRNAHYRPIVKINALPERQFTAQYKEHSGGSDNHTLTWQVILICRVRLISLRWAASAEP